ncbi:MAG TPA: Uma2 family endonuclease [Niabella sp.]|nr:Uma2 family endonuclease [Niabella sp.]HQX42865.1 Uma2 family endonuclease [Niabella sp.]HRB34960.1 Uma2 family endonuclease [Niabella sp.]HRB47134.1 Uma2 family endonuclease [Niabella sp.]HRC03327.1 Uma2 family endonuclease [Niabella sp.]
MSQLDKNKSYTYADYLTWRFDDRVELIKGKLFILSPAPAERHQRISGKIHGEFFLYFKQQSCNLYAAPFDVRLTKNKGSDQEITTVVQPDICVICDQNKIDERGCLGAPDLVVEIVSPATIKKDLNEKFNLYEENEVKEYWVVMPDSNAINQYVLIDNKYELRDTFYKNQRIDSTIFEGMLIPLEDIFK